MDAVLYSMDAVLYLFSYSSVDAVLYFVSSEQAYIWMFQIFKLWFLTLKKKLYFKRTDYVEGKSMLHFF